MRVRLKIQNDQEVQLEQTRGLPKVAERTASPYSYSTTASPFWIYLKRRPFKSLLTKATSELTKPQAAILSAEEEGGVWFLN